MRKFILSCLALAGLGLSGAVVAQTIGSVSDGYIEEGNLVRSGGIIKTITMSNKGQNADTCRKACDAQSDCGSYRYEQRAKNRKPVCYLRLTALPARARRNHGYAQIVSGTKLSYLPDVLSLNPYPGRTISGGATLRQFKIANEDPMACADACYRDGNCSSFTYLPKTRLPKAAPAQCTLHRKGGTLSAKVVAGVLSGSKSVMTVQRKSRLPAGTRSTPIPKATLSPKPKPVIKRPGSALSITPDKTQKEENPSLSDDIDVDPQG